MQANHCCHENHMRHGEDDDTLGRDLAISALLTAPLILQMTGLYHLSAWVQLLFATIVQFLGGWRFYRASYFSALKGRASMDLLIALGTTAAYAFSLCVLLFRLPESLYFESSATIITLVLLGRWLESKSKRKASEAIQKLFELQPKIAKVKRNGNFEEVPISEMHVGDEFLVRPGENIPVDGTVLEGQTTVNEAMLTGESLPLVKEVGSKIFAGTGNQNGSIIAKAIQVGKDTALARIIGLVEQAQNSKAPIQRLADVVSEYFVPAVVLISLLTFLAWWMASGEISKALICAVSVLVIACPCALGLATPTVIAVASGLGAKYGILFKEAGAIEQAEKIETLIIDKTGTLTEGNPSVAGVYPMSHTSESDLLTIALSLESRSQHPLAEAIVSYAQDRNLSIAGVHQFNSIPGKGVSGDIDGKTYSAGSVRYAREQGILLPDDQINELESKGETIIAVWEREKVLGVIGIADRLRKNSRRAIGQANQMGIHTVMLTGDRPQTAQAISHQAGIQESYAEVLPEQKAQKVRELKNRGQVVGMVGDGINDAPALASASVGFAIGAGSDVAIEASDITLMKNDLLGVIDAIDLSKATMNKAKQNLFFAFIYNILGIPIAALGFLNPIVAAAAMALSSLSVVSNALLLRFWRSKN